ncbi:MAG: sulfatase-like hydrolase/transferase [Acidobacteriota bacterium]|nr:sulfatase-like hydrolase/transferase [Acidobacteriota bacterium]
MLKNKATVILLIVAAVTAITIGKVAFAKQGATVALVNAASYESVAAPGSIAALFGNGFTTQVQAAPGLPLPTALAGASVKIGGKTAPLFFVSPSQINLQVPSGISAGNQSIEVFVNNSASPAQTGSVTVAESSPGIFTINASGRGQAVALNGDLSPNGAAGQLPNARAESAGGVIVLFATGIGGTNPAVADGQASPSSPLASAIGATTVTVGELNATVLFSGLSPGFVGLWQINIQLPDALPTNAATPVRVTKGRVSFETTLAITGRNDLGSIAGIVTDALSGARLNNATVTLPQSGGASLTAKTNAQGEFNLTGIRAGNYSLQFSSSGFITENKSVTVTANSTSTASLSLAKQKPNIIMIVADDLGYADLGVQGSADVLTPNIDSIARNGIRFTNGYVSAPVCSPSRAGFLTGRYQQRFGYELNPAEGDRTSGLPVTETTIANRLKNQGYTTGAIGKWHLGTQSQFLPQQRGFDEFFGFLIGMHSYTVWNQPNNPIYRGTQTVTETTYLTDAFSREATDFIQRNRQQPFFLYLAGNAPHDPMQATDEYLARFPNITDPTRKTFAAMLSALDDGVGKVLAKLREHNLEENTLVIFFSDNGGIPRTNTSKNDPFSGQKDQLLEGGIHIPFMMQWKGYLPAGVVSSAPVISLDVVPTAVSAAMGRKFSDSTLDGVNLIPFASGADMTLPHTQLFWRSGSTQYAARVGDWKLLFFQNSTRLYNLATDQTESTNLAGSNPTKLAELQAIYQNWNSQLPPAP